MTNVASLSLAINYPTLVSVPHTIINGFKNLLAIAAVTDIEFKEAQTVREESLFITRAIFLGLYSVAAHFWPIRVFRTWAWSTLPINPRQSINNYTCYQEASWFTWI